MQYIDKYDSPLGEITLASDGAALIGLWFARHRYREQVLAPDAVERPLPVFDEAKRWLDIYFSGRDPGFTPPLHIMGSDFRIAVCKIMLGIPYGKVMTYGEIAWLIAAQMGKERMSAQAVGGAVGHNPISLIIPCHRVVGTNGSLTGYGGGMDRKVKLLELEKTDMSKMFVPKKGTAL